MLLSFRARQHIEHMHTIWNGMRRGRIFLIYFFFYFISFNPAEFSSFHFSLQSIEFDRTRLFKPTCLSFEGAMKTEKSPRIVCIRAARRRIKLKLEKEGDFLSHFNNFFYTARRWSFSTSWRVHDSNSNERESSDAADWWCCGKVSMNVLSLHW